MALSEHVFLYCERGTNGALLAEPFNAGSNAAFLLTALAGLLLLLRRPAGERSVDQFLLVALVFLIGLGSLTFHLFANRATELADVVPIGVFMLVYLGFALNRFLGVPPGWTVLLLIGFTAIVSVTPQLKCWGGGIGFFGADVPGASACLNGSVFYLPALLVMFVIGGLLRERGHKAAPYILWAALIFAVSVSLRSLDLTLCDTVAIDGRKMGTHFAWHVLNALALFLLLRASLDVVYAASERPVTRRAREEASEADAEAVNMPRSFLT
ncbi:MAG: ceramidase domain-containing protein [Methyloceanibacter sp.]